MTENQGRFSRAMDKAGAGDRLSPGQKGPADTSGAKPTKMPFKRVLANSHMPAESVYMLHDRRGGPATETRALRGRLRALKNGAGPRVVTISSAHRAEGKTTTTLNLAAALAEVEEGRVLVVDGDLEAPDLHHVAGIRPKECLNDILKDGLNLDGRVYETAIQRVDVIPARNVADEEGNEIESLLTRRCEELLRKLRNYYSYVLVDTPPVSAAAHAATFGKFSDGVLLVVRLEKTPRMAVRNARETLEDSGAEVLGCVMTHKKHHVPDFIYKLFGQPASYYYQRGPGEHQEDEDAD